MEKWDNDLVAYLCVIAKEGQVWVYLSLDKIEWTDPYYCHQN